MKRKQVSGNDLTLGNTNGLSRCDFLSMTALVTAGLAIAPLSWASAPIQSGNIKRKHEMKTRKLGSLEVSVKLASGA